VTVRDDDRRMPDAAILQHVTGLHPWEIDEGGPFSWAGAMLRLQLPSPARFLELRAGRPDPGAVLAWGSAGAERGRIELPAGWGVYDLAIEGRAGEQVEIRTDPLLRVAGDRRELGVMIRDLRLHDDPQRHALAQRRVANLNHNEAEYRAGAEVLTSTPPKLRLTLEVTCNIADRDPCVYCSWDWAKRLEVDGPAGSLELLDELGRFLDLATEVIDCSYGEPPLNRAFPALVDRICTEGRRFAFTSNGQPLGSRNRAALLGRPVDLYVSLDAASAAGYARYRDNRFDLVIDNLRALCREKTAHGGLPLVSVSFIVMRSNRRELAGFLRLMKEIGVDRVYLRALWPDDGLDRRHQNRGGAPFDYDSELMTDRELAAIGAKARALADAIGLWTIVEWWNFVSDQEAGAPLCSEPWKTAYALNRGIMPCCYGRKPLAAWRDRGERTAEQFLGDVLNGPAYRALRRDLAAGRLGRYCEESPNCPIVRRQRAGAARRRAGKT
jgi:hypothetical protein